MSPRRCFHTSNGDVRCTVVLKRSGSEYESVLTSGTIFWWVPAPGFLWNLQRQPALRISGQSLYGYLKSFSEDEWPSFLPLMWLSVNMVSVACPNMKELDRSGLGGHIIEKIGVIDKKFHRALYCFIEVIDLQNEKYWTKHWALWKPNGDLSSCGSVDV